MKKLKVLCFLMTFILCIICFGTIVSEASTEVEVKSFEELENVISESNETSVIKITGDDEMREFTIPKDKNINITTKIIVDSNVNFKILGTINIKNCILPSEENMTNIQLNSGATLNISRNSELGK